MSQSPHTFKVLSALLQSTPGSGACQVQLAGTFNYVSLVSQPSLVLCSIKEPRLYDYVIFNDDLEDAFAQLVLVAKRALSGKQGNGSQSITGPVTLVAEEEPSQASEQSAAAAAPVKASAQVSRN